jgi:hypothetical protein
VKGKAKAELIAELIVRAATHVLLCVLQALFGVDGGNPELRSLSKAETHYDSFNRHFPVARLTSKTAEVQQVRTTAVAMAGCPPIVHIHIYVPRVCPNHGQASTVMFHI